MPAAQPAFPLPAALDPLPSESLGWNAWRRKVAAAVTSRVQSISTVLPARSRGPSEEAYWPDPASCSLTTCRIELQGGRFIRGLSGTQGCQQPVFRKRSQRGEQSSITLCGAKPRWTSYCSCPALDVRPCLPDVPCVVRV